MKNKVFEIRPLVALLLVMAVMMPAGIAILPATPALATVDNVTITSPLISALAYSRINGQVPVIFTLGIAGATAPVDISLFLTLGGVVQGAPSSFLIAASDNSTLQSNTYNLTIPSGIANGTTYGVRVDARHPSGGSGAYTSTSQNNCIVINSTHIPAAVSGLLPASGSCSADDTPTFSWTAITETTYTFKYNFQLSTSSSFSSIREESLLQTPVSYTSGILPNATYYWRVQAVDQYGNTGSYTSAYSICIDDAFPTAPGPYLTPADVSTIGGSYNPTYSWTKSTDNATCANIKYFVETYSDVALTTLVDNVTGVANPSIGNPSVSPSSALGAGTYYWRVSAYDCAGNATDNITTNSYTIPGTCTDRTISLGTGWNLISLPICPLSLATMTPAALVAASNNPSAISMIQGYNANSGAWQWYYPGQATPSLTEINVRKGYWIQTTAPVMISIVGTSCPVEPDSLITHTLYPGWNLVGVKSCSPVTATNYFGAGVSNISYICSYTFGWDCGAPTAVTLEPVKGYWVYYGGSTNYPYGLPCN